MINYAKVVESRVMGVSVQNSDSRLPIGDSSGGTFTSRINPLRGTLLWDRCTFVLHKVAVAGGATGGSYTLTLQTDAVSGYTGLPIAEVAGVGPNSASTIVFDSLHQSPSSPMPTHVNIDQTAAGGGITFDLFCFAKQYRGHMGSPAAGTAERIIMGNLIRGVSSTSDFSGDEGVSADTTFALGTSGSQMGMQNMRLWDNALYWGVAGNTIAGTHDVAVVGTVGGTTFVIAESHASSGVINVADERFALLNRHYGLSPNPSHVIWTEVTAGGVSDFRVVVLAKSGRGSMGKR